jgi:hypothetical protein
MIAHRFLSRWTRFWFPAETDIWLTILRVGVALQVIVYCFSLRTDWFHLFNAYGSGLLGRELSEVAVSSESPFIPRLSWFVDIGRGLGLDESSALWFVWMLLVGAALLLAIGLFSRTSAFVVWFLHLCSVKSGVLLTYGVDDFTTIGSFYLMLSPLPGRYSFDHRFRMWPGKRPEMHGFVRRILQLHLCIAYFFGGFAKACGPGWWDGDSVWRSLTHPPFDIIPPQVLLRFTSIFPIAGIAVILLELGYPIFIWPQQTRLIWLTGIIAMHTVIGLTMGMYQFALILIILNIAAFGPGCSLTANFFHGRPAYGRGHARLTAPQAQLE